jgi:hypothetical protein
MKSHRQHEFTIDCNSSAPWAVVGRRWFPVNVVSIGEFTYYALAGLEMGNKQYLFGQRNESHLLTFLFNRLMKFQLLMKSFR